MGSGSPVLNNPAYSLRYTRATVNLILIDGAHSIGLVKLHIFSSTLWPSLSPASFRLKSPTRYGVDRSLSSDEEFLRPQALSDSVWGCPRHLGGLGLTLLPSQFFC